MYAHQFKIAAAFGALALTLSTPALSQTGMPLSDRVAQSEQVTGRSATMQNIKARDQLIIGSELKFPRMNVKDPASGRNEGFMADLSRVLAKQMLGDENKVAWSIVDDDTRIPNVVNGSIDLVIDTTGVNPERAKIVGFSDEIFRSGSGLLVKRGSPIKSVDDIHKGTRVIYVKANPDIKYIKAKVPDATYIEFENSMDAFAALKAGKGDVFTQVVTHLYRAASEDADYVLVSRFTNKSYNVIIKKDDPVLRDYLNDFLRSLKSSGEYDRLYQKWFAAYGGNAVDLAHSPKM
jgi:aspartate/glutamate/glutamine transport system substrate-binding protein